MVPRGWSLLILVMPYLPPTGQSFLTYPMKIKLFVISVPSRIFLKTVWDILSVVLWASSVWVAHNRCGETLHCDECALINTPRWMPLFLALAERTMWKRSLLPFWLEMNGQQQRDMWCLGLHSSLPDWGVKDGGVTWLVLSLFVQSSEGSHRLIANRRPGIREEWSPLGFTNLKKKKEKEEQASSVWLDIWWGGELIFPVLRWWGQCLTIYTFYREHELID